MPKRCLGKVWALAPGPALTPVLPHAWPLPKPVLVDFSDVNGVTAGP